MMNMRKGTAVALAAMLMCLTACGQSDKNDSDSEEKKSVQTTTTAATENSDESIDNGDTAPSESEQAVSESESDASSAAESAATESAAEAEEFVPVEGLSEKYGDLDNRSFAYEGKVYKLGESTLKDLIDGGVPIDENDLNNKDNNVNANYETDTYGMDINDFVSMQFKFVNITEEPQKAEDCLLSYVSYITIYVPHDDYEESLNEEIRANIADASQHVCFSFPLTLTREQLIENNGEYTEMEERFVNYSLDSEVYMATRGYHFGFEKDAELLKDVTISWLP